MKKIILASNSPRRKELLDMLGIEFDVLADNTPEPVKENTLPSEMVMELAKFKGDNVLKRLDDNEDVIIISADTVVSVDGLVLGKPKTKEEAFKMLEKLSGRKHLVYTGVYIRENITQKSAVFYEKTEVYFKNLDINEIRDYINTEEPMDKAGAYGIQSLGSVFVEKISGDYFNVVGLPICALVKSLKEIFDINIF